MSLTPADIHNTEFAKASLGRRGYDENDVDTLLDEAIAEMIRLLEENDALRGTLDAGAPAPDPAEVSAATAALDRAHQACDHAEHDARRVRQQLDEAGRAAAAATPTPGVASSEQFSMMVQHTADAYVHEARDTSRTLLAESRELAGRTLRAAQDAADAIARRSHDHRNEADAGLVLDRERVMHDIDALTRFAADYRSALERHLHRHEQSVDGTTLR